MEEKKGGRREEDLEQDLLSGYIKVSNIFPSQIKYVQSYITV